MNITPADVRAMLRADVVSLVLGVPLVVAGAVTVVLWGAARRRARSLPPGHTAGAVWLGIFALLYGVRLLVRSDSFRLLFDTPGTVFEYVGAVITYIIPIPFILFLHAFTPSWRRVWRFAAIGLSVFAVYAVASDVILRRPYSAEIVNNLLVITFIAGGLVALFRRGVTPSRELGVLRLGVLAAALTALVDNLRGIGVLRFPGPDVEPFGFTVLVASLGTLAATRVLRDGRRLAALDRELNIARQIQSSILPQAIPRVFGVNLAARYRPMTAVAGDFYDFLEIDDRRMGVLVADVSGHGVPAALLASMVKVALAAQQGRADQPAALLAGMNETLCGRLGGQFVTAAYLFIDARSRLIRYAAAGHPPMLRFSRRRQEIRELEQNGFALGFMPTAAYEHVEQPLEEGDRVLLYTDGLIEAANAGDELFGIDRLKSAVVAGAALAPDAAANALVDTMQTWSGQPANDDLTMILFDWAS